MRERGDAPPPGRHSGQVIVTGLSGVTLVQPGGQARTARQVLRHHIHPQPAFIRKQHGGGLISARPAGGRIAVPGVGRGGQHARAARPGHAPRRCGQDRVQVHVKRPAQPSAHAAVARTGRLRD
ncbi:MAG TPA: hypothetical protein VGG25_20370 [Streptosporangiaceae bacterium]